MERLCQGQTDALDELYARYARKLYAFCDSMMRAADPGAAEDVVQDVFVRLIKAAHQFDPRRASFRTWLYRIARNRCLDVIRRRRLFGWVSIGGTQGEETEEGTHALEDVLADPGEGVEDVVIEDALVRAVRHCIDQIGDERERQALLLYYLAGKVYREIGEIVNRSTSMARNRVKAAQEKVKACLEGLGFFFST